MEAPNLHHFVQHGGTVEDAIALLQVYCPSETLLVMMLTRSPSPYAMTKMKNLLDLAAEANPAPVIIEETEHEDEPWKTRPTSGNGRHVLGNTDRFPEHLIRLDEKVLKCIKQRDTLRAFLFTLPEGDELAAIALSIVSLDQRATRGLVELNHFVKYGQILPGTEPITDSKTIAQMMNALKVNPPYITKNKNSTNPKIIKQVAQRTAELTAANNYISKHL